jgi:hypothetical protein
MGLVLRLGEHRPPRVMVLAILLVTAVVLIAWLALLSAAFLTRPEVAGWARAHALVLTEQNEPMVSWYWRTAGLLRTLGVLAGLVLPYLLIVVFGLPDLSYAGWQFVFVGYLLGALYAEVALVRPAQGRAFLVPRTLGDYLPARLLLAQRALGIVLVVGATAAFVVVDGVAYGPGRPWLMVPAVTGVALLALELLQRWVVRRPQPMWSPSLVAADDAIRSQSVHSIAGSGIALGLVALALITGYLASSRYQLLRWVFTVPTLLIPLIAIIVCLHYGHRSWRVTRFDRRPAVTSTC